MTNHSLENPGSPAGGRDVTVSTAAAKKSDKMLKTLEIKSDSENVSSTRHGTLRPLPVANNVAMKVFAENETKLAIRTKIPSFQQRIDRTDQLVYCITLLLKDSIRLSSSEQEPPVDKTAQDWLTEIKNDPIAQDRLQWTVTRMVETFVKDAIKNSTYIAEIVALGPILQKELYRKLLSFLIQEYENDHLLDIDLLQGVVQLVQSSSHGYLLSDDLVKILSVLRVRLQGTHQQSSEHPYHLTLAIARVLDVMADHRVQDLDRVLEHEPLSEVLSGLTGSSDPYLMYQACYAFQALQYVPNDETVLQAVLRHSRGVLGGAVKITALGKLDLESVLGGLDSLQESLGGVISVAGTVYGGVSSLMESGQGALDSLKQGFGLGKKQPWYAAIRAAYAFAQAGQLVDLNHLICEAACRGDPLFQWGICQLLGEIAVDTFWPVDSRQQAIILLGRIYKDDPEWGRDKSVKAWMLTIIDKLGSTADQDLTVIAIALMQEVAIDDTPKARHPYPLRSCLPIPATSPILAKVQDIPYLEYDLYRLRLQRLKEYDERAIYVPPQAKPSLLAKDDELFPLQEKVYGFLTSDCQVMLILGDSGSGKSTFNRHLEHLLWTEYKRGGPIPLFINLPAIDDPEHDMVTKQLQFHNFQEDQILEIKLHRQLVLICDGYDESQQRINLHRSNFLNQSGQWDTKMVISCRSQYLGTSYQDRFKPQSTNRYKSASQGVIQEAVIAPFSKEQIQEYIEQYVPLEPRTWSIQDYLDKLTTIPNLMDLVKNPFLLLLALEALPDVIKGKQDLSTIKVVRVQLYDTFVKRWLNVNKKRLLSNTLTREDQDMLEKLEEAGFVAMGFDFSTRLASAMFENQNGKALVKYIELKDKITWKIEFFGTDPDVRMLREASPLIRSGSFYQFLHRSMLEYFFSCTVIGPSGLEPVNEFAPQSYTDSSDSQELDPECPLFTRNLLDEPAVIQFLSERVQENVGFKDQLLEVVEKSKSDTSMATAASNSMTILVRAAVTFHGHDFRGIRIPGADLSGGQFDSALFQEADLTNVDLSMSWLRKANFTNAKMEGVRFGELPYLEEDDSDVIFSCSYSPNGRMLAVGLAGGGLALYDTDTWEMIYSLVGHEDDTDTLAFSPDSQQLVSGGVDRTVRVWDCSNGDLLWTMEGHMHNVRSVAFSPCGRKVASAGADETVRLWDSVTGEALLVFEGHTHRVNSVKFAPDGLQLVSGSLDKTIRFWDIEAGEPGAIWELNHGLVLCLDVSSDGQHIVSGHCRGILRLWNTSSGSAGPILQGHTDDITSVAFSSDGQWIASASDDSTVRVWDSSAGALLSVFRSPSSLCQVSFSPDGQYLASVDGSSEVRLRSVRSGRSSMGQHGHNELVMAVAYLPTGQSILSGSKDKTIRQWDALTGAAGSTHVLSAGVIFSVAISPNFEQTAVAPSGATILLRDFPSNEHERVLEGHSMNVLGLTYSPCGRWIASSSDDKTVRLWDMHNGGQGYDLHVMNAEVDDEPSSSYINVFALAFSPTGFELAVGDAEGRVCVYDTQTKKKLKWTVFEEDKVSALAYSPNGQELAIGVDSYLSLWDQNQETPVRYLEYSCIGRVYCIAYSPCERWIAFAPTEEATVRLCRRELSDMEAWSDVAIVEGSRNTISAIAWNPVVPLMFVTGSADRSVRVWRISESLGDSGAVSVDMVWGSNIGVLSAFGMVLEGIIGLDAVSRKLLIQCGAVDDTLISEADETDPGSDDESEAEDE
ncbi:hypothetical protein BGZ96_007854 [Linnemannia gamsii]|uniref:WD40 repeat-like protein n=1 Tax=Linnemannia gamsii TaxID=64522 RepID=A0ABQ7K0L5_9FUNG|nr:hypothetical protein BGZ96_007854 [Linnemannia gamsii]